VSSIIASTFQSSIEIALHGLRMCDAIVEADRFRDLGGDAWEEMSGKRCLEKDVWGEMLGKKSG
jgi:hypothetical protein